MDDFILDMSRLRARHGKKWQRYGPDVIPAWIADMDFSVAEPVQEAIESLVARRDYGYLDRNGDASLSAVFATRMRDSAFKRTLRELPVGSEVEVEPPKGTFGLPEDPSRPLVFVAGGIGITVFRSMLRFIHEERLPYRVTLIYSNRDRASTAFLDELRELEQALPDFRLILTMTQDSGWKGETRKVDAEFVNDYLEDDLNGYTFLVAGPPAMAEGVQGALQKAGVRDENVIAERYSGY